MSDLAARIERLRRKLAVTTDPEDRADLEAAIAALEQQAGVSHTQTISGGTVGLALAGNLTGNVYLDGRRADAAARLLAEYLARLRGRCGSIALEGVRQQKQVNDVLAVSLNQVYTQLTVDGTVKREAFSGTKLRALNVEEYLAQHTGDDVLPWQRRVRLERPLTPAEQQEWQQAGERRHTAGIAAEDFRTTNQMSELLDTVDADALMQLQDEIDWMTFYGPQLVTDAIVDNQQLVLLGEPGSGKSTALRYLALTLAEAGLDATVDLTQKLAGWERLPNGGQLLPVFVPLLPFAQHMEQRRQRSASAADLWTYLADHLEPGDVHIGLAEAVHAELSAGRVLLMLDGLDEVASAASRHAVVAAVRAFAAEYPQCRIVVSCRVRAYAGDQNRAWQLPGWPTATLAAWDGAQQQHFIAAWYAAAVAAGGLPEAQRASRVAALQRAVAASADLQRLAPRPLLLTIMALVHLNDGLLPEDRVTLYSRCVDILLGQWELRGKEGSVYGDLMGYIGLPERDVQRLRPLLTKAAFTAHSAATPDNPGNLGRDTLRLMAADQLAMLDHPDAHRGAQRFLEYTDVRAGLLQASDAGDSYVFPHLTFQEYLAGLELVSDVQFVQRIMARRTNDRWRVPIMLGVGHLVSEGALAMPYQLLQELINAESRTDEQRQRDLLFAVEITEDVDWDRLEQGGATFKQLRRQLARELAAVVEGTALPASERVKAGVLLGDLGDLRPGVCTLPPAMVPIAGGTFVIGNTRAEFEQLVQHTNDTAKKSRMQEWYGDTINNQVVTVAAFEIGKYSVTNAQYQLFMTDDGYNPNKPWWDDTGRAWLTRNDQATKELYHYQCRERKDQPQCWDDTHFGKVRPNHPVVSVSWYEAMAFCRWLTEHSEYNRESYVYSLPTEIEWEYAARSSDRRIYAWGNDNPSVEHANYEGCYSGTTTVGCFPHGTTPEGVHDLGGNVLTWTRTIYVPYPYNPQDGREVYDKLSGKEFVIRGSGWPHSVSERPVWGRIPYPPDYHTDDVSFRIVRQGRPAQIEEDT